MTAEPCSAPAPAIDYHCQTENSPNSADLMKREILDAVKRWYQYDWLAIENKLRTSIVEGISVFLSLFDDNPPVKRTSCPPKEYYDPKLNADGRYGSPLRRCSKSWPLSS
ncbi:MAG: hypothetical protein ABSF46_32080 [Terriglobia bacterium]